MSIWLFIKLLVLGAFLAFVAYFVLRIIWAALFSGSWKENGREERETTQVVGENEPDFSGT